MVVSRKFSRDMPSPQILGALFDTPRAANTMTCLGVHSRFRLDASVPPRGDPMPFGDDPQYAHRCDGEMLSGLL